MSSLFRTLKLYHQIPRSAISLFDTRTANNINDRHAHLSSDQFLILRTGMREDILQLCECLVLRLRQKDKSKSTSQDGCECLHPIECHISLYVNNLSNIKYIIHYSENLYPIEARHADCIHHREENLQLKKGSNVPCVLKIAKDITKKCVISSFRIDKDFHVEEFISTIQETQIT